MDEHPTAHDFGPTPLGIRAREFNIADLLSRSAIYRVPLFQRPFTWEVAEVNQLLLDLWNAFVRRAYYYFIGQLIFITEGRWLDIADGQQRLTTMTMVIAYARDRLPAIAQRLDTLVRTGGRGRLQLSEADAAFFLQWVQTPGRMIEFAEHEDDFETDAQNLLRQAAGEIARFFDDISDSDLKDFILYFARCASFTVIDCSEVGDAAAIYVAMNNRGKTLDEPDLLKGMLLMSPDLTADDRMICARAWETEEKKSGRENFSRLLSYVPKLMRTGEIISPGDVGALRETIAHRIGIKNFLLDFLPRCAKAHRELCHANVEAGPHTQDVERRVLCLQLLSGVLWEPLAIAYQMTHGAQASPNIRAFYLFYERFIAASHLKAAPPPETQKRMERAWTLLDDEAKLLAPDGPFEFDHKFRSALRARIGMSAAREESRRYIVLRANAALGEALHFRAPASVEHILPKTPNAHWRRIFPDKYNTFANMLGNYTLLTEQQNDAAGSKPFPEKMRIYADARYPQRKLTESLIGLTDWTPEQLYLRHDMVCMAMSRDWELARRLTSIVPRAQEESR